MKKINEKHRPDDNQTISNAAAPEHHGVTTNGTHSVNKPKGSVNTAAPLPKSTYFTFPSSKKKLL